MIPISNILAASIDGHIYKDYCIKPKMKEECRGVIGTKQ